MGRRSLYTCIAGVVAAILAVAAFAAPNPRFSDNSPSAIPVDVELVIAVDVSYSMDPEEQALQREGYIIGLTSREFLHALREGPHGKIAITYFEWAGASDQRIVMPWRVIDGPEAADAVAAEIARAPYRRASRTSISGALGYAKSLFASHLTIALNLFVQCCCRSHDASIAGLRHGAKSFSPALERFRKLWQPA